MENLLQQMAQSLAASKKTEEIIEPILVMLGEMTGMESTYLTSIDLVAQLQHIRYARNAGQLTIPAGLSVPWADTLCKRALDSGQMATADVSKVWGDSDAARALGIQTYMSAPIRKQDGDLLGTLCAASASPQPITPQVEACVRVFATIISNFMERELLLGALYEANDQLARAALTDALTGLANRRAVYETLQMMLHQARRDGHALVVGVIDLDGFKAINDSYGHLAGDQFLKEVANRLQGAMRASDCLGRTGGDEFVVVGIGPELSLPTAADPVLEAAEPKLAAERMRDRVAAAMVGRYDLGEVMLDYAGASVGVVALDPADLDGDTAIQLADAQMYQAKQLRKRMALDAA